MATSFAPGEKEIWESTIEGRVSVQVENSRGRPQTISTLGKGSRMRLTAEERILIEEVVRHDQNNPFRNGMLVQVGGPPPQADEQGHTPSNDQALLDTDLMALFDLKDAEFEDAARSLSEVNVRRLKTLITAADASKSQIDFINDYIIETWPIGGDNPTNAEARGDRTVVV